MIHTDGWTWEDMEIKRSAAMTVAFPSMGGRGGRGGSVPDSVVEILGQTGVAGGAANARRTYDEGIAKLNDFFDNARRYQKAKAAHMADFKTDLKFEAMQTLLDEHAKVDPDNFELLRFRYQIGRAHV